MSRSRLAQEVTAFLGGHHLEVTRAIRGERAVEPWMWLNAPAHRSVPELRELADAGYVESDDASFDWADARAVVCAELLRRSGADPVALTRIQATHVVPLELDLAGRRGLTPWTLAQLTLATLGRTEV